MYPKFVYLPLKDAPPIRTLYFRMRVPRTISLGTIRSLTPAIQMTGSIRTAPDVLAKWPLNGITVFAVSELLIIRR